MEISEELWEAMAHRFVGKPRTVIRDAIELKPIVDRVDEIIGPMYGLNDTEIEYIQNFDAEYGRESDELDLETLSTYTDQ